MGVRIRNKLIADLMLRARYIERLGTGIKKMKDLVKLEGLKPIKFEWGNFFTIIFYRKLLYTEISDDVVSDVDGIDEKFAEKFTEKFAEKFALTR